MKATSIDDSLCVEFKHVYCIKFVSLAIESDFLFLLYIGNKGSGFDPGSVNMQQANLGTSLNMFGGAKGGDPNKMDANSLMGGSSGMMAGANAMMGTGGSSSGGGMNMNPGAMMGGGSGSGGMNPMNMMSAMGGSSSGGTRTASM